MKTKPTATCPHCGEKFTRLKDGMIPTHDFPRPCRQVCPGSGEVPKKHEDTPLWKDDPMQQVRDWRERARTELLIYGFAVVKELARISGQTAGQMECPLCQKTVRFSVAESNGHCRALCETEKCINIVE